jgi:hypothetical protein
MPKKKNRPFRSGSTQHYEEKLFKPLDIEQEKAGNVFQVLKIFCFFRQRPYSHEKQTD